MKDIHKQFVLYGKNAREWMRKCALLLPEIERQRVWEKKGFSSIYEYAAKLAGMSRSSVDSALWVMKKIENKPELKKVAEEHGVQRVRPVANLATPETDGFWAEKATSMSKHALETYAKEHRKNLAPGQPDEIQVSLKLKPALAKKIEKLRDRDDFEELLEQFVDSLEGSKPEPVETESRHIPVAIQRYVLNQTAGKCACCNRKADVFHHVDRFATNKTHDPNKIIPLCNGHHQLAHLGLIANEQAPPDEWQVRVNAQPSEIDLLWQQHFKPC